MGTTEFKFETEDGVELDAVVEFTGTYDEGASIDKTQLFDSENNEINVAGLSPKDQARLEKNAQSHADDGSYDDAHQRAVAAAEAAFDFSQDR
jgi:hypothetical protein